MKIKSIFILLFTLNSFSLALENISLQLKWYHQFQFAGYYVAKEMGFYKDAGLNVEIKEYKNGINIIDQIKYGHSDFGISGSYIFNDKNQNQLIALSAIFQKSTTVLLTKKSSGIDTPEKLKGKSISLQPDDISSAAVVSMLASVGLGKKDVVYKENSFDISKFLNNEVDALFSYRTNEPYLLEKKGIAYNILDPSDYGFDFYSDILFTSSAFAKKNPEVVEKFYQASIKGWKYAFEHIDTAVALIDKKYNTQHKSIKHLQFEAHELKKLAYVNQTNFAQIDPDKIKRIVDIYKVLCFTDKNFCTDGFIYTSNFIDKDNNIKLTNNELNYLESKKKLRVCINNHEMPYEGIVKGKYIGIIADYIKYFEKKIGIPIEIISMPKNKRSPKYCDMVPVKESLFQAATQAFLVEKLVIVTDTEKVFVDDFKNIENETFVVTSPLIAKKLKMKYPNIKLLESKTITGALQRVNNGEAFGFIDTKLNSAFYIQQSFIGELKISGTLDSDLTTSYSMTIVDKNDTHIKGIMDKTILTLNEEQHNKIQNQWISVKYERNFNSKLSWGITSFILLLTLFLLYRNFLITQQRKKLKALNATLDQRIKKEVAISRKKDKILFQQAKSASMGEMINHISHQWRQPLSIINGLVISLDIFFKKGTLDYECLDKTLLQIEEQTDYMSKTIENFRDYFRPDKKYEEFHISEAVENVLKLMQPLLDQNNIDIEINKIDDKVIKGYFGEYVQVIIVILMNAKDALLDRKIKNPKITITINGTLQIADNAQGIKEYLIGQIFEPFFTTKSKHEGTGVGLHMAKLLIENSMHGELSVKNGEEGAIFTMTL